MNALEPVFTTSNVQNGIGVGDPFGTHKAQFTVNTSGVPAGFTNDPVYAEPLYVSNITMVDGNVHNVVYFAALNGEVYAYDADAVTGVLTPIWRRDETQAVGMQGLKHNCDMTYETRLYYGSSVTGQEPYLDFAGVISTPVIQVNQASGATAIFVVNQCKRNTPIDSTVHWYLNALNLSGGANLGALTEIAYSASQVAAHQYGPQQPFAPSNQLQRAALLITAGQVNGTGQVYRTLIAEFGTATNETGKNNPNSGYQGWMFAYDVTNSASVIPQSNSLPYTTQCIYPPNSGNTFPCSAQLNTGPDAQIPNPCGDGGGVWMSNRGAAANISNQVFSVAGNGGFNYCQYTGILGSCQNYCAGPPTTGLGMQDFVDFGEAALRMSLQNLWAATSGFWPDDYFVPYNIPNGVSNPNNYSSYFQLLNAKDWDMGVPGVLLFDDNYYTSGSGTSQMSMAVTASKRGDGYAMLQSGLGQYDTVDQVVAEFGIAAANPNCGNNNICDETRTLAYWNPYGASGDGFLLAWPWHETLESFQWVQSLPGSQYTFQRVSTTNNPFTGLGTGLVPSYPGGNLSVTVANPPESPQAGVVWATAVPNGPSGNPFAANCARLDGRNCPGFLLAYSLQTSPTAGTLSANQIWPATLPASPDFEPSPYALPLAVNGKVYAPAYGLSDGKGGYTLSGLQVYGF